MDLPSGASGPGSAAQLSVRLLSGLPTPLARALRRASASLGSPRERFEARIAFLEGALRLLVAVQDAERVALGLERPGRLVELLKRLERPTLGLWAGAAAELGQTLERSPRRLLPAVGAELVGEPSPSTPLREAVEGLIELRNRHAHDGSAGRPAEALLGESEGPFRRLVAGLEPLCGLRLVVEAHGRSLPDERWAARLAWFRGEDPAAIDLVLDEPVLPAGLPVLLAEGGEVLRTLPWLVETREGPERGLRILERWEDGGPAWSEPGMRRQGGAALGLAELCPEPTRPLTWFDGLQRIRRRRCLPPEAMARFQPALAEERAPRVRACRPIRLLGRGGTGAVWLVEDDEREGARLALKVLHPTLAGSQEHIERMRREFELLRRVQVPGVVRVLDVWLDPVEGPCLLMEWIEGRSLAAALREGPLPEAQAVAIALRLLDILAHAHERGVIHRDIKPSNILLAADGPRLIDFGVARELGGVSLTATADIVGTLAYAAPEQLRGERVGPAADLYGLACTLREMMLGLGAQPDALIGLAGGMQRVLRRATRLDPAARYASAEEMAAALREAAAGRGEGCALAAGDSLPGGLVVLREVEEVEPGLFLLEARTRSGQPAAVLAPRPEGGARAAFFQRIETLPAHQRAEHGCVGVRTTEEGIPYAELLADQPERRARALLGLLASRTGSSEEVPPPAARPEEGPGPAPPPEPEPAPTPRTPPSGVAPEPMPTGDPPPGPSAAPAAARPAGQIHASDVAILTAGAVVLGALAAHSLGNAARAGARPAPNQRAQGSPKAGPSKGGSSKVGEGLAALAGLAALFGGAPARVPVKGPAQDLLERTHHLGLLLLALEAEARSLELTRHHWQMAWSVPLGGLLTLVKLAPPRAGCFGPLLAALPDREQVRATAVELARRPAGTEADPARVRLVRAFLGRLLRLGAEQKRLTDPSGKGLTRIVDGGFQVSGPSPSDGWWVVDLQDL